jgi:outer membrane protein
MKNIWKAISIVAIGLSIFALIMHFSTSEKRGYIELNKLYSEFEMTKEYTKTLQRSQEIKKTRLDSMSFEIDLLGKQIELDKLPATSPEVAIYNAKVDNFLTLKKNYEEDDYLANEKYRNEINIQINKYVEEYAKENNYDVILGGNGSGNIMYLKNDINITDDVLVYINKKYNGE